MSYLPSSLLITQVFVKQTLIYSDRQFSRNGAFILLKVGPRSIDLTDAVPERHVLYAASQVDHEALADAFHTKLQEDEGMVVLGGGFLEIDQDKNMTTFRCGSEAFGEPDSNLVQQILQTALQHTIQIEK